MVNSVRIGEHKLELQQSTEKPPERGRAGAQTLAQLDEPPALCLLALKEEKEAGLFMIKFLGWNLSLLLLAGTDVSD